jgi:ElaB/YqjD/DUF883 family membrane-anchored ribosome-binding protein
MSTEITVEHTSMHTRENLIADFKQIVASAEELLTATASQSEDVIAKARQRAELTLREARLRLGELEHSVSGQARRVVAEGERQIKDNPWGAVGVGAGVGLLLGLLIARR